MIALIISWISALWNIGEGVSSLYYGISKGQLDLAAYGGQSVVEIITAVLVLLRLRSEHVSLKEKPNKEAMVERERKTIRLTGVLFLVLCILIVAGSGD